MISYEVEEVPLSAMNLTDLILDNGRVAGVRAKALGDCIEIRADLTVVQVFTAEASAFT